MLIDQLNADMKEAMKARDALRLGVLRMTLAEIKNARIEKMGDLSEADVVQVLKKAIKSRMESAEQYQAGNRQDLVDKETGEAKILEAYLPQQLSGEALEALIAELIAETGAASAKDFGTVMKALMAKYGPQVDGKAAGAILKRKLGG